MDLNRIHDIGALCIAGLLVLGDIFLVFHGQTIPNDLGVATGAAVGYVFRGAVENTVIPALSGNPKGS